MALTTAPTCQYEIEPNRRCARPALRKMRYCYSHQRDQKRKPRKLAERARQHWFESVNMNDAKAIQKALAEIMRRLALGLIDHNKAGAMLHKLQVATAWLQHATCANSIEC